MSNKSTINGKAPLSTKKNAARGTFSYQASLLDIPGNIKQELEAKGLEGRWISFKTYADNYGYHKQGWTVFKSDSSTLPTGVLQGSNPDGIIRRGDLVLACRTKEACDEHRQILQDRADRAKGYNKAKADELRQLAKENSVDAKIYEGYDENG